MISIQQQLKLFEIGSEKKHKDPCSALIDDFKNEINKERPAGSFYIKDGKKKKLAPISFMAVRMKLLAIAKDKFSLEVFLSECRDYKNRGLQEGKFENTFSRRFFGGFKNDFSEKTL